MIRKLKQIAIAIDWELLGADLASMSTDEQIPFFKGFAKEMELYPTKYAVEMQLSYIGDGLSKEAKKIYRDLGYDEADNDKR